MRKKTDVSETSVSENEPIILPETAEEVKKPKKTYEVQKGDTLQSIAVRFGIAWKVLANANNITEPYIIKIGQKLKVPNITEI